MTNKTCTGCLEALPLGNFHRLGGGHSARCKACKKHADATRYAANKERAKAASKAYREAHREKYREYNANYYREHAEEISTRSKLYYEENRETRLWQRQVWREANRDKDRAIVAGYMARKKACQVEPVDYAVIRKRDTKCYLCGEDFLMGDRTHVDHKIPLSRTELSPTHSYENCALTHAYCNQSKGSSTPEEFWARVTVGEVDY